MDKKSCSTVLVFGGNRGIPCGYQCLEGYHFCFNCINLIGNMDKDNISNINEKFDVSIIWNYVSLCNFIDKKQGRAVLINQQQVNKWGNKLRKLKYDHIYHISPYKPRRIAEKEYLSIIDDFKIYGYYEKLIDILFDITEGKMSLCGGAVLDSMMSKDRLPNDYDFFFHCDTVEEADKLLKLCMEVIACQFQDRDMVKYSRSQGVQTVSVHYHNPVKFQFIRRCYKYKDQILLGFDLPCCQYGYNKQDGFFTTIAGGMAYATGSFPVDLTQRSLSFGYRLKKYEERGFIILLPGIDKIRNQLVTPDGTFNIDSGKLLNFTTSSKPRYYETGSKSDTVLHSDYEGNPDQNWFYIASNKIHNVTFYSNNWEELYEMPENEIRDMLFKRSKFVKVPDRLSLFTPLIRFLGDNIIDFVQAYEQNNKQIKDQIWNSRIEYFKDRAVDVFKHINEPQNAWRYKNPGSQNFGKFNPIISDPREWYGPNYIPVKVGINDFRFTAFYQCWKQHSLFSLLPYDMFRKICNFWLMSETNIAKIYLFTICS